MLSATIDRYAWGTLRARDDEMVCINSFDFGLSLSYSSHSDLAYDGKIDLAKAAISRARRLAAVRPGPVPPFGRAAGIGPRVLLGDDGHPRRPAEGVGTSR